MRKKKVLFHQDYAPFHKSIKTKNIRITLSLSPYSTDLTPNNFYPITVSNEKMIDKKRHIFHTKKVSKCCNDCITFEGN